MTAVIRVGILGAGGMGNAHARHYRQMAEVELTFFDKSIEKTEAFAKAWGCPPAVTADELIGASDIVDICLPTDLHRDTGLKVIAAGRAVFIEKPLARSLEECAELINAAEVSGVPLMVGQVVRFFPEFKKAHDLVKRGAVGEPAAARMRRGGGRPKGEDMWFRDYGRSGGVLLDLAVHDFDWLRWTLGEISLVYSRSLGLVRGSGPDYALTTLTFESGAVGHVESTWMDPSGFRTTLEVAGSGGILEYDSRLTPSLRTHIGGDGSPRSIAESNYSSEDDPYYRQLRAFLKAVQSGGEPPITGHDGAMAVSIALAAIESAKTGRAIKPAGL